MLKRADAAKKICETLREQAAAMKRQAEAIKKQAEHGLGICTACRFCPTGSRLVSGGAFGYAGQPKGVAWHGSADGPY